MFLCLSLTGKKKVRTEYSNFYSFYIIINKKIRNRKEKKVIILFYKPLLLYYFDDCDLFKKSKTND